MKELLSEAGVLQNFPLDSAPRYEDSGSYFTTPGDAQSYDWDLTMDKLADVADDQQQNPEVSQCLQRSNGHFHNTSEQPSVWLGVFQHGICFRYAASHAVMCVLCMCFARRLACCWLLLHWLACSVRYFCMMQLLSCCCLQAAACGNLLLPVLILSAFNMVIYYMKAASAWCHTLVQIVSPIRETRLLVCNADFANGVQAAFCKPYCTCSAL